MLIVIMLIVIMLIVIMLSVIMLSVDLLNVVALYLGCFTHKMVLKVVLRFSQGAPSVKNCPKN
jgi:hypothetical protein